MPPRLSPTVRQQRLGIELRRMRELVGVTPKSLAATIGTDLPKISQMENGKSGISAERLRIWALTCGCADGPYLDALLTMTQDRRKYWWDGYRGRLPNAIIDIAEMEHHASSLSILNSTFIPGLLQTPEYAAAVFERLPRSTGRRPTSGRHSGFGASRSSSTTRSRTAHSCTSPRCACSSAVRKYCATSCGACWRIPNGPVWRSG